MSSVEAEETFSVTVVGAGISIQRDVSAAKVAVLMSVIMGPETADLPVEVTSPSPQGAPVRMSLREFLDDAKAATKPDQIVAIGHYLAIHESKDTFSREDIKSKFQSAREPLPSNFPRDFNTAIGKGLIAEDHAKAGTYYVTRTGALAVEKRFGTQA